MTHPPPSFRLNHWQVEPALGTIANGRTCIKLDPRPMHVLVVLAQHAGQVLSQQQLETAVWGELMVTSNSVYQCITQLRKALGDDAKQPQFIQTIPRKGYRLIARIAWQTSQTGLATPAEVSGPAAHASAPASSVARSRWRRVGIAMALLLLAAIGLECKRILDEHTRAESERERAEQLSELMLEVFTAADPRVNLGRPITARELLEARAQHISADLDQQPQVRARMLESIGRAYRRQGLHELAVPALEAALEIRRRDGDAHPETGSLLSELGSAYYNLGRFADSDRAFTTALQIRAHSTAPRSKAYARLLGDIGSLELVRGHPHQAVKLLDEGLQLLRALRDADLQQQATLLEGLSEAYLWLDDAVSAERAARSAFEIRDQALPPLHPDRVLTTYALGEVLRLLGRHSEAEPLLQAALTAQRRLYGAKGVQVARTLNALAALQLAQGQQARAAKLGSEALASQTSPADSLASDARLVLIEQLLSRGDFAAAERHARSALAAPPAAPAARFKASAEHFLGEALLGQKRLTEAQSVLRSALERWQQLAAPGWRSAMCASALGEALHLSGRAADAEPLLRAAQRAISVDLDAEQQVKRQVYQRLARFYTAIGRQQQLLQLEAGNPRPQQLAQD